MDKVKYMVIYMDNSCEVHFSPQSSLGDEDPSSSESAKLIISPCGSEFVYKTYSDNVIKG